MFKLLNWLKKKPVRVIAEKEEDKPGYIFCSAEMRDELAKRAGDMMLPDGIFVIADSIPPEIAIVASQEDFMTWLYSENHDRWRL